MRTLCCQGEHWTVEYAATISLSLNDKCVHKWILAVFHFDEKWIGVHLTQGVLIVKICNHQLVWRLKARQPIENWIFCDLACACRGLKRCEIEFGSLAYIRGSVALLVLGKACRQANVNIIWTGNFNLEKAASNCDISICTRYTDILVAKLSCWICVDINFLIIMPHKECVAKNILTIVGLELTRCYVTKVWGGSICQIIVEY
jgi:hypothetical protein